DDEQPIPGSFVVLELTAVAHEPPGRQVHLPLDPTANLFDEAPEIATAHIALDDDAPLRPLALDRARALFFHEMRQASQGDPIPVAGRDEQTPEVLGLSFR